MKMTNLKKEVGENKKFTHLQNTFTHLQQTLNKFTHTFITSTNLPTTHPVFTNPEGVFDYARLKVTTCRGVAGCKIEAQCKGGVRAASMSSLIVAAEGRRGSLGVGF